MRNGVHIGLLGALLFAPVSDASEETLEQVSSRGAEQKYILTEPEVKPVASVILIPGGHGKLGLGSFPGSVTFGWGKKNNLVRTRKLYADKGLLVATLDAPSDRRKMNAIWRMSADHAEDIRAVAKELKKRADVPVWVIGTSMGTFSAANAGIRLNDVIDGVVLTSSVTRSREKWEISKRYPEGIVDMDLSAVKQPVLVVANEDDKCPITPPADVDKLVSQFKSSARIEKVTVSGGDPDISDPCKALSAHGFLGIEELVVDKIASFVTSN